MSLHLETIAIGDELLTGKISDTNTTFVAAEFFRRGMRLEHSQTVADDEASIQQMLRERGAHSDFVVCFGGLGPTSDDKTALTVARLLGVPLVQDPVSLERLHRRMAERNRPVTPQNLKQVLYPEGSRLLPNSVGLAPGFQCRIGRGEFFFLPGVPAEMKPMFLQSVLPEVEARQNGGVETYLSRTWKCLGIPESELQRRMDPIEAILPHQAWLGYRTRFPENHLTLYWRSRSQADREAFEEKAQELRANLSTFSYTEEEKEFEELILDELESQGLSLAFAESCTGGLCAQRITRVAGSSKHFWGGAVVYQIAAKEKILGVRLASDEESVSADCSRRLAQSLREKSGCDLAVAVTGYMGPSGGTSQDPVGTVYIAVAGETLRETKVTLFGHHREANQWGASTHVLGQTLLYLAEAKKNRKTP